MQIMIHKWPNKRKTLCMIDRGRGRLSTVPFHLTLHIFLFYFITQHPELELYVSSTNVIRFMHQGNISTMQVLDLHLILKPVITNLMNETLYLSSL